MKNKIFYTSTAVMLIGLLVLLSDPFMLWMPAPAQMLALLGIVALVCIWTGFVMYEKTNDERDVLHRMNAGRIAYLSGIAILTIAIIIQGLTHKIDPWISTALGTMIISKILSRFYLDTYQ